ncbi:MAG: DUF4835 family protein [Balneolaceae bacterium]
MIYIKQNKKLKNIWGFFAFVLVFLPLSLQAQEMNCEVTINTQQLTGSSFDYIDELKPVLENYINEFKWTDQDFREEERIECKIQIVLNSGSQDFTFAAEAVFQAQRPIYSTNSKTTSILLSDNTWQFSYPEGRSLIHDELQFDALTGFVDFFIYMILGYDFDSFSNQGGDPYFSKAQNILNLAQTTSAIGWTRNTNNGKNRYTLVSDISSTNYEPLRTAYYRYHRLGLDQFGSKPEEARTEILEALKSIRDNKRRSTSNFLYDLFFDAKAREIGAVFDAAEPTVRLEAYNVLQQTDQGHLSEYERLQN